MGYIIRNGTNYFGDNSVTLTQAQYDALPSSKLTDGVSYFITDAPGALIKNGINYSGLSIDLIYPVGSIYMSVNNVNPGTYLTGTTWVEWGTGRVPVGVDTKQTEFEFIEQTGGEKTHTLSTAEMPAHRHALHIAGGTTTRPSAGAIKEGSWSGSVTKYYNDGSYTENLGGGGAHNNLQPYITCSMWKRTA